MTTDIQMNVSYRLGDIECNVARKSNSSVVCLQHIKQCAFYNPHGPAVWRYDEQSGIIVFEYWRG